MLFKMVFKQTKPYYYIHLLLLCYVKLQLVSTSHVCITMQTVTAWMQRCSISCRYGDCCTGEHCVPVCVIWTNWHQNRKYNNCHHLTKCMLQEVNFQYFLAGIKYFIDSTPINVPETNLQRLQEVKFQYPKFWVSLHYSIRNFVIQGGYHHTCLLFSLAPRMRVSHNFKLVWFT
jgi:hypothetical protein